MYIRPFSEVDAPSCLKLHRSAVHTLGREDYSQDILEQWSGAITVDRLNRFMSPQSVTRVVAEQDGEVVGFGELILGRKQLTACYVSPNASRNGVGTAIIHELEGVARSSELNELTLTSSITAVPFYKSNGYREIKQKMFRLSGGGQMTAVEMHKYLRIVSNVEFDVGRA